MTLKVVGAGFGRTGTYSLKLALEQLGFGPCHHMAELAQYPEQIPYWQAAARDETPQWDDVFNGYNASIDWPSSRYWREISTYYPDAKVLLSVRPFDSWFKSIQATIYPYLENRATQKSGASLDIQNIGSEIIVNQIFEGDPDNKAAAQRIFNAHIAEVQQTIAPDRLLTYDVSEGWTPLCEFLGVAAPDAPFPRTNSTEEFQARTATR
ncbi:MAG: sulfotransferase family protein [Alphaproteobacteria bacterium]|nr:sulfotransferase family protein [Alphaproteobacteria bacterium]